MASKDSSDVTDFTRARYTVLGSNFPVKIPFQIPSGNEIPGATGPTGPAGNTILNGVGAPDNSIGAIGDFYLDTSTTTMYGPKTYAYISTCPTIAVYMDSGATNQAAFSSFPGGTTVVLYVKATDNALITYDA